MSVAPTRGPVQRPGEERDFTEIFQRLDDLERALTGGWRFNFDNEGGWGYVQFNSSFDLDDMPDPLAQGGTWSAALEEDGGDGFLIGSTTLLHLLSRAILSLTAVTDLIVTAGGAITMKLATGGQTITILDSSDSPMLRMTEGSPDLHLPTGGNVIFDL